MLEPGNLTRDFHKIYFAPSEEEIEAKDKQFELERERVFREADEQILRILNDMDTNMVEPPVIKPNDTENKKKRTLGISKDVKRTGTISKGPATVVSRNAASKLSAPIKTSTTNAFQPTTSVKPPTRAASFLLRGGRQAAAVSAVTTQPHQSRIAQTASKSTIGYTKGRQAAGSMTHAFEPRNNSESVSARHGRVFNRAESGASDVTITPARYAATNGKVDDEAEARHQRLRLLGAFDYDDDDDGESGNMGGSVMTVPGSRLKSQLDMLCFDDAEEFVL
jgi:hypothetical protein